MRRSSGASASSTRSATRSSGPAREACSSSSRSSGVPGIGKSRLVYELFRSIEAEPDLHDLAPGPLAAVRRRRQLLGAGGDRQGRRRESSSPTRAEDVERKLRAAVEQVAAEPSEADWMAARLGNLVGLQGADDEASRLRARASRPGGASSRRWPTGIRSSSSSKTCTGPTTACSTSSTSSWTGRAQRRSSCSAPRGPSCWSAGRAGVGARRTRPRSRCRRSRTTRRRRLFSVTARPGGPACRDAIRPAGARGGEPAVRRAVRADARASAATPTTCRCPRRCRGSSPPGSTGSRAPRSPCCRTHRWSARCSGSARWRRSAGSIAGTAEEALHRARAQGARPARPALVGRGRGRVLLPPPAGPRRRLRPDPAGGARGQAPGRGRVGRRCSAGRTTTRRCSRHHFSSALEYARASGQRGRRARRAGPARAARGRRPRRAALQPGPLPPASTPRRSSSGRRTIRSARTCVSASDAPASSSGGDGFELLEAAVDELEAAGEIEAAAAAAVVLSTRAAGATARSSGTTRTSSGLSTWSATGRTRRQESRAISSQAAKYGFDGRYLEARCARERSTPGGRTARPRRCPRAAPRDCAGYARLTRGRRGRLRRLRRGDPAWPRRSTLTIGCTRR